MNEITKLLTEAPSAATVGACVYLILTTRRLESRIEAITDALNIPRPKKRRTFIAPLLVAILMLTVCSCAYQSSVTPKGTKKTSLTVGTTNSVPIWRDITKTIRSIFD